MTESVISKQTLYYATSNPSKFRLFAQFIPRNAGIKLKQFEMNLFEEQTEDQLAIAIAKAKQAWQQLQKPLIVDEIGVYFHKYHNFPGAFTKFVYKGLGWDGIHKLMNNGDELSVQLIVVYISASDTYKVFTVREAGVFKKLVDLNYDQNAPFDAVFVPKGLDKSYTELQRFPEIYRQVYCRAICMREILNYIKP